MSYMQSRDEKPITILQESTFIDDLNKFNYGIAFTLNKPTSDSYEWMRQVDEFFVEKLLNYYDSNDLIEIFCCIPNLSKCIAFCYQT